MQNEVLDDTSPGHGLVRRDFIVMIFLHYANWKRGEDGSNMELHATKNDVQLLLRLLKYCHGDESRIWKLLFDFECQFEDGRGVTRPLPSTFPTKDAILEAIAEASSSGGSGLIYYAGHCEHGPDGTSFLRTEDSATIFYMSHAEITDPQHATRSYLVPSDANRLYGEDIFAALPTTRASRQTYSLVFDACSSEPLLAAELNYTCDENGTRILRTIPPGTFPENRLIVISAAKRGELARTIELNGTVDYGFLTYYLVRRLSRRIWPRPSAIGLVRYLNRKCAELPLEHSTRQHPSIASNLPLTGRVRLLPGSPRRVQGLMGVWELVVRNLYRNRR